jgi:hypothetical protein
MRPDFEAAYRRLAAAVLAYDAAIQLTAATGSGQRWVADEPDLDILYERMLVAARQAL